MVAEIRVHVDEKLVVVLDGVAHGLEYGRAGPELSRTVQHVDVCIGRGGFIRNLAGAVRRVVINYENMSFGKLGLDALHKWQKIVAFVVGCQGNKNGRPGTRHGFSRAKK